MPAALPLASPMHGATANMEHMVRASTTSKSNPTGPSMQWKSTGLADQNGKTICHFACACRALIQSLSRHPRGCFYQRWYMAPANLLSCSGGHNRSKHWIANHNQRRHSPLDLADGWHTKWWPHWQFSFFLALLDVNALNTHGRAKDEVAESVFDFWKGVAIQMMKNNLNEDGIPIVEV